MNKLHNFKFTLYTLAFLASLSIGALSIHPGIDSKTKDESQNLAYAYNLATYGVYSLGRQDDHNALIPDMKREPLYPLILAMTFSIAPKAMDLECLIHKNECASTHYILKSVNIVIALLVLTSSLALCQALKLGPVISTSVSFLSFVCIGGYLDSYLSEPLAALLILLHSRSLLLVFREQARTGTVLLGAVSLSLLILTKAIFLYWLLFLGIALAIAAMTKRFNRSANQPGAISTSATTDGRLRQLLAIILVGAVLPSIWITRNWIETGEANIAGRSVSVLAIRAEYGRLTPNQLLAGLVMTNPFLRITFSSQISEQNRLQFSDDSPEGVYRSVRDFFFAYEFEEHYALEKQRDPLFGTYRERSYVISRIPPKDQVNETAVKKAVLNVVSEDWPKQILLTLYFFHRGLFPTPGRSSVPLMHESAMFICFVLYPFSVLMCAIRLFQRRWIEIAFLAPAIFAIALMSAVADFVPRYAVPAVPLFLAYLAWEISRWRGQGRLKR